METLNYTFAQQDAVKKLFESNKYACIKKYQSLPDREREVVNVVGEAFGINPLTIFLNRRHHPIVEPRAILRYIYVTRFKGEYSLEKIGDLHTVVFQDHTTVINSLKLARSLLKYPVYVTIYNSIMEKIQGIQFVITGKYVQEYTPKELEQFILIKTNAVLKTV